VQFHEAVDFLYSLLPVYHRVGPPALKPNLDNTLRLLAEMGNPHVGQRFIHVAGTNGKGSTSAMIASVLMEAGIQRVGLYTSPHLVSFTERIRINGTPIPEEWVARFVTRNQKLIEAVRPSFFEFTVAMCFAYFKEAKVDWSVIEVGLGGRLDSTNVITPQLSVVTTIGFDHKELLGNTLAAIAAEKAGIFKPGVPAVVGTALAETRPVFDRIARQVGVSALVYAELVYNLVKRPSGINVAFYDVFEDEKLTIPDLACDLVGNYQAGNIRTALAAFKTLDAADLLPSFTEDALRRGLAKVSQNTGLAGRMTVLNPKPLVIADVAHNSDGIGSVVEHIRQLGFRHLYVVLGVVAEKDTDEMLALLPTTNATYFWVKPPIPRGLSAMELKLRAERYGLRGSCVDDVAKAATMAKRVAQADDVVLITGSFFVVAEVLKGNAENVKTN
jgi:dihydrofolate synthase/folylpolyglutamate synthase